MTTDEAVAEWMNTKAFKTRYVAWWDGFGERLSNPEPVSLEEIEAAILHMAVTLGLPREIAGGIFKAELFPERYAAFQGRTLQ